MFKPGDAKLETEASYREGAFLSADEPIEYMPSDSRGDHAPLPHVYLPHSCDSWVIGGAAEVRAMIAELTALLPTLDAEEQCAKAERDNY